MKTYTILASWDKGKSWRERTRVEASSAPNALRAYGCMHAGQSHTRKTRRGHLVTARPASE